MYQALKQKSKPGVTLPDYYDAVLGTMEEFRRIFRSFKDKTKFRLSDYNLYLPRIAFTDQLTLYQKTLEALGLEDELI